ncbi:MAG TPA: polysaccharide biosynthesis C-terminal domain-containing protein [Solirubrobacterales bacterium]|nr:polysaccharide biosynthesis C-terminal domain-containing protein [Solirubrobacterales bacterium]
MHPSRLARGRQRLRSLREQSLFRNSVYIMGTTAVTSLLGFGFWLVAARTLSATEVGRSAALISAMLFVSVFTNLGLGQVLVSRLASRAEGREWSITVTTGLALTAVASLVGGAIAAVLLPTLIPALKGGLSPATFLLLPLGVTGAACSLVIDYACIAERHAKLAFVRNSAAALLRIGLIPLESVVPVEGTTWILGIWAASFLLIDFVAIFRELPALGHDFRPTLAGWRRELGEIKGLIAGHQSINLGAQASSYLLPVLVSARLGPEQNAYFYTTFMVASALFFIAPAIGNALFAEGAHEPEKLGRDVRRAARQVLMLAGPPALVLLAAGPLILGFFGPEYADEGSTLLLILVGAAFFDSVLQLSLAVLRVRHELREAAIATWATLVVAIAATWFLLPPLGLEGAGLGWALGKVVGVLFCAAFIFRGRPLLRSRATYT